MLEANKMADTSSEKEAADLDGEDSHLITASLSPQGGDTSNNKPMTMEVTHPLYASALSILELPK